MTNNAIKKAKEIAEQENKTNSYHQEPEGPINLVQVYQEMQQKFPHIKEEDLKAEMVTFYASGTDTVGLTVSNALLALGKYTEVQDRLYEEITSTLGGEQEVTSQDIDRMPYLDQVYKETLRWSLILPYVARQATEDIKLSTCTVPAGSTVVVALMGIHLDPKTYPDPERFDPERFSPENSEGRHRYSFLPLSGGPRGCIGKRYAELFVKTAVIHVLRRFTVRSERGVHEMKRKLAMVMVSTEGYHVTLEERC